MAARKLKGKESNLNIYIKIPSTATRKWESQEWKINVYIKIPSYGSQKMGK